MRLQKIRHADFRMHVPIKSEEKEWWEEEEGCWARMRKGVWVEWFMSYEFFDL